MWKLTNIWRTRLVVLWIFIVPISVMAQQRVVISPFYSDFATLTNSVPAGWSISPYIQLGVKVEFPPKTTFDSLKQYQFENSLYFNSALQPFFPVVLQCGQLRWYNQNFSNWNIPNLSVQERNYIETTGGQISLSYNDCSFISGNLTNKRGIPSFTYIHNEDWGTLFPISLQRSDTTIYSLQINPSLFYLLTDKGMVDLYTTENIVIPPHEKFPSIFLFYKPIYKHKVLQYKGIKVNLLLEDEKLAEQLFKRTNSDSIGIASRKELVYHPDSISDDSLLYRSLHAIDRFANLLDTYQKHIVIAKTGLNFRSTMGKENMLDTITANFSLTLDSVLLVDNEMYRNQTLIHELLHFIAGKRKVLPKEVSAQESNFLNESTIEYLAKYIYGKYISQVNLFVDSLRPVSIKSSIIKKAKRSIRANKTISVGLKNSAESANTAWVYYDLLPNLLHQLAVYSQVGEEEFASAVFRYLKNSKQPQSLQNFLTYMKEQGLGLQEKQTGILWHLLKN